MQYLLIPFAEIVRGPYVMYDKYNYYKIGIIEKYPKNIFVQKSTHKVMAAIYHYEFSIINLNFDYFFIKDTCVDYGAYFVTDFTCYFMRIHENKLCVEFKKTTVKFWEKMIEKKLLHQKNILNEIKQTEKQFLSNKKFKEKYIDFSNDKKSLEKKQQFGEKKKILTITNNFGLCDGSKKFLQRREFGPRLENFGPFGHPTDGD